MAWCWLSTELRPAWRPTQIRFGTVQCHPSWLWRNLQGHGRLGFRGSLLATGGKKESGILQHLYLVSWWEYCLESLILGLLQADYEDILMTQTKSVWADFHLYLRHPSSPSIHSVHTFLQLEQECVLIIVLRMSPIWVHIQGSILHFLAFHNFTQENLFYKVTQSFVLFKQRILRVLGFLYKGKSSWRPLCSLSPERWNELSTAFILVCSWGRAGTL